MGFLDKFKKAAEKKEVKEDEVILDGACLNMYPGQANPKHYGTIIP